MKLLYRGHAYDYNPTLIEDNEVLVEGTYRGHRATMHQHKLPLRRQPKALTYRGVKFYR